MKKTLIFLLLLYSVAHLGYSIALYNPFTNEVVSGDFQRAFDEAKDFRIHRRQASHFDALREGFVYHSFIYYLLLWPLSNLEFPTVNAFFYLLQFILFPLAIFFLAKAVSDQQPSLFNYGLAAILAVNFQPFLETLALHKVEGIEFFLISCAILAFKKKKDLLAGACLLFAAGLKYLPGILILYFLFKREVKLLLGALAAGIASLGLLWIAFDFSTLRSSIQHALDLAFSTRTIATNFFGNMEWQSLTGSIYRLFASRGDLPSFADVIRIGSTGSLTHPKLAYWLTSSLKVVLFGLYLFLIRKRWSPSQRAEKWPLYLKEISLTLIMLVVVVQAFRVHYGILLLPAFVMMGLILSKNWNLFGLKEKALFCAAYFFSALVIPGGLLNKLPPHPLCGQAYYNFYLWLSLPFLGYLLLGCCILLCYRRILKTVTERHLPLHQKDNVLTALWKS